MTNFVEVGNAKLLSRCQRDHPLRIFYVSDFDPAGQCMPVSAARKIEFFSRRSYTEQLQAYKAFQSGETAT